MKIKRMKNAIVLCIITIFLCFVALAGSTLAAGFNASKTNSDNKIQAATSSVIVSVKNGNGSDWVSLNGANVSLTAYDTNTSDEALTVTIKIENTNNVAYELYAVCTVDAGIAVTVGAETKGTLSESNPAVLVSSGNSSADGIKLTFTGNSAALGGVELSLK